MLKKSAANLNDFSLASSFPPIVGPLPAQVNNANSCIVGELIGIFQNSLKNNAQLGKGEWAVIESDESDGSFLKLPITYSIITNVDKEHLNFYGSFTQLKK